MVAPATSAQDLYAQAVSALSTEGGKRDFFGARKLLGEASDAGSADAALLDIALTANGTWGSADWNGALHLLRAAALRHPVAAAHLALVEQMDVDAYGRPKSRPLAKQLAAQPDIRLAPAFLSPAECAHLAEAAMDLLAPSTVIDPVTGASRPDRVRTSSGAVIGPGRESLPIRAINLRIAALTGTPVANGEPLSVLHYAPGQEYRPHLDTISGATNQRIKTIITYLNQGYHGGQTHFPRLDLTIAAAGGDALIFDTLGATGDTDPLALHCGLPVTAGTKWVATRWIRARAYDPWSHTAS